MSDKTTFSVRDKGGAYITQTVRGKRASSTCSYEAAARLLASKLHHPDRVYLLKLVHSEQGLEVFELELME